VRSCPGGQISIGTRTLLRPQPGAQLSSRAGILADVLAALLIIPVWSYFGALVALACALVLGLLLRFVIHAGGPRTPRR